MDGDAPAGSADPFAPRILVIRGGAIGDTVLTLPVLDALRRRWPRAHLEWVGYPRTNTLVEAADLADIVRSLDGADIARLFAVDAVLPEPMSGWLRSFDLAIHFLHDPDRLLTGNLERCGPGPNRVLSRPPMPPPGTHATDHYLGVLEELAIHERGLPARLPIPPGPSTGITAIHPGSGGLEKNWPVERFLELAEGLPDPVFVIGEADARVAQRLPAGSAVLREQSLLALARRLAGAARFIGNDSGPAHLAAALGVPTTVLFGPSDPVAWAPRGNHVQVLRAPEGHMVNLGLDEVRAALT